MNHMLIFSSLAQQYGDTQKFCLCGTLLLIQTRHFVCEKVVQSYLRYLRRSSASRRTCEQCLQMAWRICSVGFIYPIWNTGSSSLMYPAQQKHMLARLKTEDSSCSVLNSVYGNNQNWRTKMASALRQLLAACLTKCLLGTDALQ